MAMSSVTAGRYRLITGRRGLHIDRYEFTAFQVNCTGKNAADSEASSNRRKFSTHSSGPQSGTTPRLSFPNHVSEWKQEDATNKQDGDSGISSPRTQPWARKHLEEQRAAPRVVPPGMEYLGRKHLEIPEKKNPNRLSARHYGPEQYHPIGAPGQLPTYEVPFEFQYTYSEMPKVEPVAQRGPQFSPFGPESMDRPWTGCAPLPASRKKKYIIDSFNPPSPEKRGVKPVEPAGPFPPGQRPLVALDREDVIGEPLTREEIKDLVTACYKEARQLNLGRDGLTHNMLDVIHNHWKRRRVIKIKCKGVPTIDMDNICFHLEDKTGGKIIHRQGGAVFLFRGRNYNPRFRPTIPIMLWKPPVPIYPRLVQQVPQGLTLKQADFLRRRGRFVKSLCTLSRNGVYLNLAKDVRDAFEVDELVKLDCRRMNPSDIRKIGAKLKELLGIVILSFEGEHVLLWRGPPKPTEDEQALQEFISKNGDVDIQAEPESANSSAETEVEKDPEDIRKPTPSQILAAQELEALWERAVAFGMVTELDEEKMRDADYIKAAAGAPLQLKKLKSREADDEEQGEEAAEDDETDEEFEPGERLDSSEGIQDIREELKLKNRRAIEQAYDTLDKNLKTSAIQLDGVLPVDELARLLSSHI